MGIAERLKLISSNKTMDHAIEIAEYLEQELKDAAEEGYTAFSINLENRDDAHILKDGEFLEHLGLLLEGCEVFIQKTEHRDIVFKRKYYKYKLIIRWA